MIEKVTDKKIFNIKACIFDLDGTLADTVESIAYSCNEALAAVGLGPLPINDYRYYAGDGAKVLVERAMKAAGAKDMDDLESVFEIYNGFFKKDCTYKVSVFDGMLPTLKKLKASGIKIAVLSNKPHDRAVDVINKLFGEGFFDMVQGQTESIRRKPAPDGAVMIAENFGVKPEECLYMGDTNTDMMTGTSAGMYTVGVLWGFREREELLENGTDAVIEKPQEIAEIACAVKAGIF